MTAGCQDTLGPRGMKAAWSLGQQGRRCCGVWAGGRVEDAQSQHAVGRAATHQKGSLGQEGKLRMRGEDALGRDWHGAWGRLLSGAEGTAAGPGRGGSRSSGRRVTTWGQRCPGRHRGARGSAPGPRERGGGRGGRLQPRAGWGEGRARPPQPW